MSRKSDLFYKCFGFLFGAVTGALYGCYMGYISDGWLGAVFGTMMCATGWSIAGMLRGKQIYCKLSSLIQML